VTLTGTAYRTYQEQELLERIAADPPTQPLKVLTPIKAIRAKCKWCMCDSAAEIRRCRLDGLMC